jgi:hypothetical protein
MARIQLASLGLGATSFSRRIDFLEALGLLPASTDGATTPSRRMAQAAPESVAESLIRRQIVAALNGMYR